MLTGILLAVAAGVIWSLSGAANSSCARFNLDIVTYLLANVSFSLLLTAALFVNFGQLANRDVLLLAAVMIPSGFLNTGGALCLQKALQKGHHGIVFLISQAALVVPFLFGVAVMGEKTTLPKCGGAMFIFLGMISCAIPKIEWSSFAADRNPAWLFYAVASFLLFGFAQSLMSLPSYWTGFADQAGARASLLYLGSTLLMTLTALRPKIRQKLSFSKLLILCGVVVAALNAFSMRLIFASLDHLSRHGMTAIGFSLAIASSLVVFTLYSIFVLKEKCYKLTMAGLSLIVTGGVLLS